MEARHPVLDYLVDRISQWESVERIVLFGSRARGDHRERSDIDLAIAGAGITTREWFDIQEVVEEAPTLLMIDLVRLDVATGRFLDRIREHGISLYDRSKRTGQFRGSRESVGSAG